MCRSRRELSNAYLLAKFGFDTAENEPSEVWPIPRRVQRCLHRRARQRGKRAAAAGAALRRFTSWPSWPRSARARSEGSFSAVSKPNFVSKYALKSSRRDLHNALLCTVLHRSQCSKFSSKISTKFSIFNEQFELKDGAKECIV